MTTGFGKCRKFRAVVYHGIGFSRNPWKNSILTGNRKIMIAAFHILADYPISRKRHVC